MIDRIINKIKIRSLPTALTESDDFKDLDEIGKQEFVSRLKYIEEISIKLTEPISPKGQLNDFKSFINRIELDTMINLGAHGREYHGVSTWLLHSSWTFGISAQDMRSFLGYKILNSLREPPVDMNSTLDAFSIWVSKAAQLLSDLLDGLYLSTSFEEAMSYLIAIDLCLTNLYCGIVAQRLNCHLYA